MNELDPKPVEQSIASYENQVKKGYSELGQDSLDAKHWGTASSPFLEGRINLYTNREFIEDTFIQHLIIGLSKRQSVDQLVMADLGGDDGFLLSEITQGVKQKIPNLNLKGFVVDIDSTGKAEQKFKKKQESGEREKLEFVKSDITSLPFDDKSIDVLISRMAVQYLNPEQQKKFFSEIDRVLKDAGIAQIMTVEETSERLEYNKFMAEVTFIISGSRDFDRSFPTFEQFIDTEEELSKLGSSLHLVFRTDATEMPLSVEGFADRFQLSEEQQQKMHNLFKTKSKDYPEMFEMVDGVLCLKTRVLFQQYEK